jgi:hypothetical protein
MEQTKDSFKHISDSRARSQANIGISNKNMEVADVIFVEAGVATLPSTGRRPVTTRDPGCAIKTGWRRAPDWLRLVPLKMRRCH